MRFSRQVLVTAAASVIVASVVGFAAPVAYAAWTASATASFSQSSQIVPSAAFSSCKTDATNNLALLSWPAAPATLNGSAFKDYSIEWYYPNGTSILTTTRTLPYAQPQSTSLTGDSIVRVTVRYANGWNSPTPTTYKFTVTNDKDRSPKCNPDF